MIDVVKFLRDYLIDIAELLDVYCFDIQGINVSIFDLFIGFIVLSLVVSIFWKGARA